MRTWNAKAEDFESSRKWWIVDAEGQTLGRMATQIATVLRGKDKPTFTPHVDTGDFVIVVNADKVKLTGNKMLQKNYYRRSRFFGSLKELTAEKVQQQDPTRMVIESVKGMLPKNKLSTKVLKKLKVYAGTDHPHDPQKPEALSLN